MNLILLSPEEIDDTGNVSLTDKRAVHIIDVLNAKPGQVVRIGLMNGPKGRGEVLSAEDGCVKLSVKLEKARPIQPCIDLILCMPRPRVMRRLWAQLSALGVNHIALTRAFRVEKYFFNTHIVTEKTYHPLLIEGLQQAGDTLLPEVSLHQRFNVCLESRLKEIDDDALKMVAHPESKKDLYALMDQSPWKKILMVIGPEGGWVEEELDLLRHYDFKQFNLGARILRTDTACVAALSIAQSIIGKKC